MSLPVGLGKIKMRQLAGNHFLTVVEENENLLPLGKMVLWEGAQVIEFRALKA